MTEIDDGDGRHCDGGRRVSDDGSGAVAEMGTLHLADILSPYRGLGKIIRRRVAASTKRVQW